MAPGKTRVGLADGVLGRRKGPGKVEWSRETGFSWTVSGRFPPHHHPLPVFFITAPYFFPTQHIFPVMLFSCLLDYTSDLYEGSGMSVFFPPCPQHLAKCLVLKRHSINFCWMNMHTQTCIHTYVLMGIVAHRQGCEHHTIQKCKISQNLQGRQVSGSVS